MEAAIGLSTMDLGPAGSILTSEVLRVRRRFAGVSRGTGSAFALRRRPGLTGVATSSPSSGLPWETTSSDLGKAMFSSLPGALVGRSLRWRGRLRFAGWVGITLLLERA